MTIAKIATITIATGEKIIEIILSQIVNLGSKSAPYKGCKGISSMPSDCAKAPEQEKMNAMNEPRMCKNVFLIFFMFLVINIKNLKI